MGDNFIASFLDPIAKVWAHQEHAPCSTRSAGIKLTRAMKKDGYQKAAVVTCIYESVKIKHIVVRDGQEQRRSYARTPYFFLKEETNECQTKGPF
jgi:hypothetical protein